MCPLLSQVAPRTASANHFCHHGAPAVIDSIFPPQVPTEVLVTTERSYDSFRQTLLAHLIESFIIPQKHPRSAPASILNPRGLLFEINIS